MLKKAEIIKLKQVDHVISENNILADINFPFLVSEILNDLLVTFHDYVSDIYVGWDGGILIR